MKRLLVGALTLCSSLMLFGCGGTKRSNGLHFEEYDGVYKAYHLEGDISGDVVIPETYKNKPVTIIPRYAFMDCSKITSITLTENILTISTEAFANCTNLKFNEYNEGYYLGTATNPYYAFVKPVNEYAGTVEISDQCVVICGDAFYENNAITNIELPESVKSINAYSFYKCNNLESIKMPKQMAEINAYSISYCNKLKGFVIPEGVKTISGSVGFCDNIEYVVLPSTLERACFLFPINDNVKIYYNGSATELLSLETIDSWMTVDNVFSYSETAPSTTGNFWHYDTNNNPVVWE